MKRLRFVGLLSEKEELLRSLSLIGCVEVSDPGTMPEREIAAALSHADGTALHEERSKLASVTQALRVLNKYAPEKKSLLSPKPEAETDTILDEGTMKKALELSEKILSLEAEERSFLTDAARERASAEALAPWTELNVPMEQTETATCTLALGTLPIKAPWEEILAAAEQRDAVIEEISSDKRARYVSVLCRKEERAAICDTLREFGFSPVSPAEKTGTAAENRTAALRRADALTEKATAKADKIREYAAFRSALQLGADALSVRIARSEAAEKLLQSESTFYFEGWVPASKEKKLSETTAGYCCAWETEDPDPEHPEEVPIELHNNAVTRPYNIVTEMYSLPAYNGLDPNPFIAPFFALFFGIMFADMAYGLILFLAGLIYLKKAKPRGSMKNAAGLMIECGAATFLIGFLTGGFFGDVVSVIGNWFGKDWSVVPYLGTIRLGSISIDLPLNLLEGNNPLYVLVAGIALGAVHLAVGVGLGMYLKIRDGEWADALLNDLCWWVIMAGIGVYALKGKAAVLYVGIGMLVLGQLITGHGIGKITGIFGAVYNGATGYMSDLLSYSRLMALMLAGSVIASVFNQIASLGNSGGVTVGGTILFIVVFCIGHALSFALNIIGCFVHTLRLQFLEFFGKWYRDGGRAFRPLKIQTKYVDIKEE